MTWAKQTPDRAARFAHEVIPFQGQLYLHALRLTSNRSDAEDLVQETLVRAYAAFHQFQRGTNLRAWLHKILANAFLNTCRKKRRELVQAADGAVEAEAGALGPSARSAEAEALERIGDSDILSALHDLPEEFEVAIYLADIEGYPYKDIAQIMGTPIGTVTSRLHRGRRKLRRALASYAR